MPRFALVEFETMAVINVGNSSVVPGVPGPGFRYIVENLTNPSINEWTPGNDPAVGDIWDGQIPATFAPAPPPPNGLPTTMPEAWQVVLDRKAALAEAEGNFQTVAGLP